MFVIKNAVFVETFAKLRLRATIIPHHRPLTNKNQLTLWRTTKS